MHQNQLRYWLAAIHLPISPRHILNWLTVFPDMEKLFHASAEELLAAQIPTKHIEAIQRIDWNKIDKELEWAQKPHQNLITLYDAGYPDLLKQISDPPLILFVRGNKSALSQTQIAMVGSRHPTPTGLQNAEQFAHALAKTGLAITSGLAIGVDGACHRGAMTAQGITLAICGTGLNFCYPPSHRNLMEEIVAKNGAIISEFPLSTPPYASHFPRRNRIIGGLSVGVLVVEAALKSGSLITAKHALEQGKEVFAIPGSIHNPLTRGCHYLIRQGAKLVETAGDILEELAPQFKMTQKKVVDKKLSKEYRQLLAQIEHEITPMDVILLRSGLTVSELCSMLLTLELNGYVQSVAGGYVRSIRNQ